MSFNLLLVEDEDRIAGFMLRGLREEGYMVTRAADGRQGWIELQRGGWDVVLLDWWLPHLDGLELLKRFRSIDRTTPVIFLTARDAVSERIAGLDAGADDYVCKPFSFEEILARIRGFLRRKQTAASLVFEFDDIQVDLRSQRVVRAGQELELTAKEFSLLLCFVHHPGTVLSRTRLYETVWGDPYRGESNTLEVHVKELRRKLEQHGPRVIQTRRGRGYILEAITTSESQ